MPGAAGAAGLSAPPPLPPGDCTLGCEDVPGSSQPAGPWLPHRWVSTEFGMKTGQSSQSAVPSETRQDKGWVKDCPQLSPWGADGGWAGQGEWPGECTGCVCEVMRQTVQPEVGEGRSTAALLRPDQSQGPSGCTELVNWHHLLRTGCLRLSTCPHFLAVTHVLLETRAGSGVTDSSHPAAGTGTGQTPACPGGAAQPRRGRSCMTKWVPPLGCHTVRGGAMLLWALRTPVVMQYGWHVW